MNPVALIGGVNSLLQLGQTARSVLSSAGRSNPSSRFENQLNRAIAELLKSKDKNQDGMLTLAELGGDAKVFARFDMDGDGKLAGNELRAWYAAHGTD